MEKFCGSTPSQFQRALEKTRNGWKGIFDPRCPVGAGTMSWCIPFCRIRKIWDQIKPGHHNSPSFSHGELPKEPPLCSLKPEEYSCFPSRKGSAVKWDQQPGFCLQGRREGPESFPNTLLIPWLLLEAKGAGMRRLHLVGAGCYWSFPWKPINTTWGGR